MTKTFKNLESPKAGEREATNHDHWWAVQVATHWVKTARGIWWAAAGLGASR